MGRFERGVKEQLYFAGRSMGDKTRNTKKEVSVRVVKFLVLAFCLGLFGCTAMRYFKPKETPYDEQLSESYRRTRLKETSAADMLAQIYVSEYEFLSQSRSIIATSGQQGYKSWFNMVAFGGRELRAQRKYFFVVNDRPKSLRFDCEMILGAKVLGGRYMDENARRVAILKQVLGNVRRDVGEVGQDNERLNICGMLIKQTVEAVLIKLDSLPMLASRLGEESGLEFNHINLDKGKIQIVVDGDVVTVKMRAGSLVRRFEDVEYVNGIGGL